MVPLRDLSGHISDLTSKKMYPCGKKATQHEQHRHESGLSNSPLSADLSLCSRTHLKSVNQGSGQGAGRRKSAAYTVVCEHFEPTRNAVMGP